MYYQTNNDNREKDDQGSNNIINEKRRIDMRHLYLTMRMNGKKMILEEDKRKMRRRENEITAFLCCL